MFLSDSYGYSFVLDKVKTSSRFVKEIPEEYIEEVGAKPRNTFTSDTDTFNGNDFLSMHSSFETKNTQAENKPVKKGKIRKGDLITHDVFGDGVVIKLEDKLATIAFDKKFGIRKIMIDHPALKKK